ncbi:ATP-dependent DNA helicase RecG [Serratia entomophila]|uniref:ATP-dependent DNA helicase RecG n=1 Tax=Serratia entomophila TaxID=42906 RepID=UPI00217B6F1C|nr:ATP-dependent DNA helicase RecG [Serratia entomophila]CAI1155537.1 ATP-dependent DNA helicase recG [Serratia entomophila]CAI1897480.1 ATP-dependent DNA helicase recG [Serratia entomophila]CAI1901510.1 ATP-dependent DNA helicase recG [Serratia entomophila]CAI1956649.1 ATP-dependent DNA helicase recG [Serratia entomophila]CAI1981819.1 ATP-dependent DNA helicase recG [Serratia entomophila]
MKGRLLDAVPLTTLSGVGTSQAGKLAKIGLETIQDLLLHLPLRYEDRTRLYPINDLLPGIYATVEGEVLRSDISFGRRRMLTCQISDGTGILTMRFFNFNAAMKNSLATGRRVTAYGEIKRGNHGAEIIHPEYRVQGESSEVELQESLTPVYPTTEGIRQATLRKLTDQALELLDTCAIAELLPPELSGGLMSLPQALHTLHRPPPDIQLADLEQGKHPAQKRLILEELLAHNLSMLAVRAGAQSYQALPLLPDDRLKNQFLAQLPFSPTGAQTRVVADIEADMQKGFPMMRLVQGDVGSGKTLVAALAALRAIAHGKQVALMAPTELLAEQHANNFRQWFEPLGLEVGWLAGKQKGKARIAQQEAIASGQVSMVVGTHAIFQEQVQFNGLALVIIDEQHRFGVHQRLALWEKGEEQGFHAHQLIMTATPIPRTLAMTAYADLDTSVIDELPPGRTPVTTVAIPDTRRADIIQRVKSACMEEGRQAYWVCTLIEESELLEAQAAEATWEELKTALPELKVALVHGRMKAQEKQAVMQAFKQGELQLLVATTVIEVGVDVPNASLMIIENPERLGLAQLHQLRGRVGRGAVASHCVLLYKTPLSKTAQKRLQVLRDSNDGFVIAQRDLEIRGPGELLGTRQTGSAEFKVADLLRDQAMIPEVQRVARHIHQQYPEHARALIERWLPEKARYSNA